jgi:hypothetical protein
MQILCLTYILLICVFQLRFRRSCNLLRTVKLFSEGGGGCYFGLSFLMDLKNSIVDLRVYMTVSYIKHTYFFSVILTFHSVSITLRNIYLIN